MISKSMVPMMVLLACGALAGCGGDSDGPPTFGELRRESLALADSLETMEMTAPEDLPASGSARYDGTMVIEADDDTLLAGEMRMDVDFGASTDAISGQVANIVSSDEERYGGKLVLSNSRFDRNADPDLEPVITSEFGGILTAPDGESIDVEGGLAGAFGGENASHAAGLVGGSGCRNDGCYGFEGAFVVAQ